MAVVVTRRFFLLLALCILASLGSLVEASGAIFSLAMTLLLILATIIDGLLIPRRALKIERILPDSLMQGIPATVELHVRNTSRMWLDLRVKDSPPPELAGGEEPLKLVLRGLSDQRLTYTVRSYQRGQFAFRDIFYRATGTLGLVRRQERLEAPAQVVVLPDISAAGARELALSLGSQLMAGQRTATFRGEGREFESLRLYQPDDEFRYIDWKATAKRGQLISRQYQTERDQRLLIMIDLGRLMSQRIGQYSKLDYAVNAAVRLAQTALFKGDLVGLLLFSHDIAFYLPPHKGTSQFKAIVQALVSAQPRRMEPNYRLVFNYAARKNIRRTFMVCFTDLLDMETSQTLVEGMTPMIPRHLPMTVTLSDSALLQA
ncbi:MAG: DUF58 domain-containing protein, partial [Candidatus Methylacidiphilales bacterium]